MERHHRIAVVIGFLDEGFPFRIHDEPPDIAWPLGSDVKLRAVMAKAGHPRPIKLHLTPLGIAHLSGDECPLRHPDPAARGTGELMRHQMRILGAKPAQDHLALVSFSVVVRIAEKLDLGAMVDVCAVFIRKDAKRNGESFGKEAWLLDTFGKRRVEDHHPVFAGSSIKRPGRLGVLASIHRIIKRRHAPHASLLIPVHGHKLADPRFFGGHQLDLKTGRNREGRFLLRGSQRRNLGRPARLGGADEFFPFRSRRQLFKGDLFELHQCLAAGMHLHPDNAGIGNGRISLRIIAALDSVDPQRQTRAIGPDHIFVPVVASKNGLDGLHIGSDQQFVAAPFIVNCPPPRRITQIALIS